jgi:hypothetical protein
LWIGLHAGHEMSALDDFAAVGRDDQRPVIDR